MGLFNTLKKILQEADPKSTPLPILLSSPTDGRLFSRLGIQTYGFIPMILPAEMNFTKLIHGTDERIPIEAVEFGTISIYKLLQCFG
jgi:acetylornithine deacetylase/succinyl-diaminopimelate desuccinylase-like protein